MALFRPRRLWSRRVVYVYFVHTIIGRLEGHPGLSSTTQGAYGAHLRELELELVERGLGRKGAGLRTLEVGTGLRAE